MITLEVTDSYGDTDNDLTSIVIQDTTPPVISVFLTPNILWPPNHKMVHVVASVETSDNCDSEPIVELVSITMNESHETITFDPNYDQNITEGQTSNDIEIIDNFNFYLRSERSGKSDGRDYTITYRVIDGSGNISTTNSTVIVPHSF